MPSLPAPSLIVTHSGLVLGVLKGTLDPIALALHRNQALEGDAGCCIAEAVLELVGCALLPSYHEMPAARLLILAVQDPDPAPQRIYAELSFGTMPDPYRLPSLGRLLSSPFVHSQVLDL
jgi:hypothetical protein